MLKNIKMGLFKRGMTSQGAPGVSVGNIFEKVKFDQKRILNINFILVKISYNRALITQKREHVLF